MDHLSTKIARFLIFTSSSGNAHLAAAQAVEEELLIRCPKARVKMVDLHSYLTSFEQWYYKRGNFVFLNTTPILARRIFSSAKNSRLVIGLAKRFYPLATRQVRKLLNDYRPQVTLATHPFGTVLMERLNNKKVPLLELPINYEAHRIQVSKQVSLYCVAHELVADDLRRLGVAADKIKVTGMPLPPVFDHLPTKPEARRCLDLPLDKPIVLITHGAMGSGLGIVPLIKELMIKLPTTAHIIIITGHNKTTAQIVDRLNLPGRVKRLDFVGNFELYLRAADVLIGKAGGMTSTSAFVAKIPLIIFGANALEKISAQRFAAAGIALDARGSIKKSIDYTRLVLMRRTIRKNMIRRARRFVVLKGRQQIADLMINSADLK